MFETEAEEYVNKNCGTRSLPIHEAYARGLEEGFQDGAEFGYNKANEWHDLRKNPDDLPKENTTVLLLTEVEPVTARYDKKYESFFRMNDKLNYCIFIAPMSYIAWKEIVLPEPPKYWDLSTGENNINKENE